MARKKGISGYKDDTKNKCICLCFRVVFLQVSMNSGLTFISSSVSITSTQCVSMGWSHLEKKGLLSGEGLFSIAIAEPILAAH